MKVKILIIVTLVFFISISKTFAQTFNKNTDLLLANFDLKPDEDDVMAAAGLACMLNHPDFEGVNYYAVAGAYGKQDKFEYITIAVPDFYNVLFGLENEKWTDAHTNWDASVTRVNAKVTTVLNAGGKVFVQEAGQSDFTHDVLKAAIADGVSLSTIAKNVIVVQHSKWNENQSRTPKLDWVKNNTVYQKIADGNKCCNGTPEYKTSETEWLILAKSYENKNEFARRFWTMADDICKKWESSWTNKTIAAGGLDFSDTVEIWQIFNIGDKANDVASFWDRYVINIDTIKPSLNKKEVPTYSLEAHKNGWVVGSNFLVWEAEATTSPLGMWELITPDDSRYIDNGIVSPINKTYLEFTGNNINVGPPTSPLKYTFICHKTGTYRLGGRMLQRLEGAKEDKSNDVYIKMTGNFTSGGKASLDILSTDHKFFGRGLDTWGTIYKIDAEDLGKFNAEYNLIEGEQYTLIVSGRAQRCNIDYWLLYDTSLDIELKPFEDLASKNLEKYRPVSKKEQK